MRLFVRPFRPRARAGLEGLVSSAPRPSDPLRQRIRWLLQLLQWINARNSETAAGSRPAARLRYFFAFLSRHEPWKENVAATLRSIIHETDALELFSTTGIPGEGGFFQELSERLHSRLLPQAPEDHDLRAVFAAAFRNADDATWIAEIDEPTLAAFASLLSFGPGGRDPGWNTLLPDAREALSLLGHVVLVQGLARSIRARLSTVNYRNLPFYELSRKVELFLSAPEAKNQAERDALVEAIQRCREATFAVEEEFHRTGVSLSSIYRLERLKAMLLRMETLTKLVALPAAHLPAARDFAVYLAAENARSHTVIGFLRDTGVVVSRRIADFNAVTGEHYIAREREERRAHWKRALGGGLIIALLTFVKAQLHHVAETPFLAGTVEFLCYAAAFLGMQFLGFTLATKFPAMTASSLVAQLNKKAGFTALRADVANLARTQLLSIVGNVCGLLPVVLILHFALQSLGLSFMPPAEAAATVGSFSILGISPFLAAWTGVELWICSIAAGAVDNWFAYHRLPAAIEHHEGLGYLLGPRQRRRLAGWLSHNLGAGAGNLLLAFFFGMLPYLTQFFGFRLEGRHVTVSTAALTASSAELGTSVFSTWPFWLAVAGVVSMAFFNIAVSFALALTTAIWARGESPWHRRRLYLRLLSALLRGRPPGN